MKKLVAKLLNSVSHRYLPASLKLTGIYKAYMLDKPEAELQHLERLLTNRRVAIDVGANVGVWTYKMANLFDEVVSFEMNEDCYRHIEAHGHANIKLYKHGLSNQEKQVTLYLPVLKNGFISHGWATIEDSRKDALFEDWLERKYVVKPLDSYELRQVDFIKIDVEGHELPVVEGAMETIRANKPVLVIETSADNLPVLVERLSPLRYAVQPLREFANVDGTEGNYIFFAR